MDEMPFAGLAGDSDGFVDQMDRMRAYLRGKFGPWAQATSVLASAIADGVTEKAEGRTPTGLVSRAINKLIDRNRRLSVHEKAITRLGSMGQRSGEDPARQVESSELRGLLALAEGKLSDDQREVWTLAKQGLSTAKIAESLGKTEGAVKMAKKRAIERLRKALPREYGGTGM